MSRIVDVKLGARSYPIHIGEGILDALPSLFPDQRMPSRVAIVTNPTVAALYLPRVERAVGSAGLASVAIVIPDGEDHKTIATWNSVLEQMLSARLDRKSAVIALGGGVVGDIAGFAAASYQRGIDFIQIPTTLLAQVDSSVGGKTGVNHPLGKNQIGAFYQPRLVVIDTSTLSTLPDRELRAGLAEVIKYGLIGDREFFDWLEAHMPALLSREPGALAYAVETSCRHKAEVVARDETEQGERALLNFGHTFGHAIEAGLGYGKWLHGEAIAAGSVLAVRLSERLGWTSAADTDRVVKLFEAARLPVEAPALGAERYLQLMAHDKKTVSGTLTLILLRAIGEAVVTRSVLTSEVRAILT